MPGFPAVPFTPSVPFVPAATLFVTSTDVSVSRRAGVVEDPAPRARRQAALDGQLRNRDFPPQHIEDPVQIVPVDDRARALTLDGQIPRDVEVAGRCRILPRAGEREFEHARGNDNRVGVWPRRRLP